MQMHEQGIREHQCSMVSVQGTGSGRMQEHAQGITAVWRLYKRGQSAECRCINRASEGIKAVWCLCMAQGAPSVDVNTSHGICMTVFCSSYDISHERCIPASHDITCHAAVTHES